MNETTHKERHRISLELHNSISSLISGMNPALDRLNQSRDCDLALTIEECTQAIHRVCERLGELAVDP